MYEKSFLPLKKEKDHPIRSSHGFPDTPTSTKVSTTTVSSNFELHDQLTITTDVVDPLSYMCFDIVQEAWNSKNLDAPIDSTGEITDCWQISRNVFIESILTEFNLKVFYRKRKT